MFSEADLVVCHALKGQVKMRRVSMAEVQLNDEQVLLAFNNLFIGVCSHISARYRIQLGGRQERRSSSGIIVSAGAGSTGWLSSLFNMADGLARQFGAAGQECAQLIRRPQMSWETDRLVFVVREPFASRTSAADFGCGSITREAPLLSESEMPEASVIFSDGVEADFLSFNAGASARIQLAKRQTHLVVG